MKMMLLLSIIPAVIIIGIIVLVIARRRPRKLKTARFQDKWRDLQKLCASKETWSQAILEADRLLDEALKRRRFVGKTMGERLTKAQRLIADNEGVWFGHKLRNRIEQDPNAKLKESEVKQALVGIRQALKDLGAFPNDK